MGKSAGIIAILALQGLCAGFLIANMLISVLALPIAPVAWQFLELLEIGAALGLLLGLVMGTILLRHMMRDNARVEEQLRVASGAFMELLTDRFTEWGLTKAEKDVALFSIKGLSTAEIAEMRKTSEGTVKAQTNAIYKKAGVSGRAQLLSLFIDDLFDETLLSKQGN
ncbi:helix-turn-helix transcriptional regulator [Actibacterium pelagium]|uniref:LuxR family transcriptional regulator n=1 Tax=Actibacterium pelagium TaxID=2029103 RepID=A0A917AAX1_9RHOB|nr:helix-turn-helix transcriptional regulator [Actibacterium pelagium]GGE39926.1 LuxR family transcriptional regulator [Actibacterium pelagium]